MYFQLYEKICLKISKKITHSYTTSFSIGIMFLKREHREAIYSIYAFVRLADEIVDTFLDYPQMEMLKNFEQETFKSIHNKISTNPVIHSFQKVVNEYSIDLDLVRAFFRSMEMDLKIKNHNLESFNEYVYGSAMIVGMMCLKVFCKDCPMDYEKLKKYSMKLGEAFQKVNFLRDLKNDYKILGRNYFPQVDFNNISQKDKDQIIQCIKKDFQEAYLGIKMLNKDVKLAVLITYYYYLELLRKIEKSSLEDLLKKRIRLSFIEKLYVALRTFVRYILKLD